MTNDAETYIKWEPLAGLPEHPYETIHISYNGERLTARIIYAIEPPASALFLEFGTVEAFKVYQEFSDPWMETTNPQAMIHNPALNSWVWPLQEVSNSRWVKRMIDRNGGIESYRWRHFVVVTMDVTLHVMTCNELDKAELEA